MGVVDTTEDASEEDDEVADEVADAEVAETLGAPDF